MHADWHFGVTMKLMLRLRGRHCFERSGTYLGADADEVDKKSGK